MLRRERIVVVERCDQVAARFVDEPVDGRRAGDSPERERDRRVARALGHLDVADPRIFHLLDRFTSVGLWPVAADEQLDVLVRAAEHRRDRPLDQELGGAERRDANRDERLSVEVDGPSGLEQRLVDLRLQVVHEGLRPLRVAEQAGPRLLDLGDVEAQPLDQLAGAADDRLRLLALGSRGQQHFGEVPPLGHVVAGSLHQAAHLRAGEPDGACVECQARVTVERRRDDVRGERGQPLERASPIRGQHENSSRVRLEAHDRGCYPAGSPRRGVPGVTCQAHGGPQDRRAAVGGTAA